MDYRGKTARQSMSEALGLDPDVVHRANILPFGTRSDGSFTWAMPEAALSMAKALILPGHVAQGGKWTPEDVTEMALDTNIGGALLGKTTKAVPKGALGVNVWQGGPHKYGPKGAAKSLEHIGKGEGAQAYGWGRYDAGSKRVGEEYRRDLSETVEGIPSAKTVEDRAAQMAITYGDGTSEGAIKWLEGHEAKGTSHTVPALTPEVIASVKRRFASGEYRPGGYLYKHDLPDEDIARYLDWDKPIKGNAKLETLADKYGVSSSADGGTLYSVMESAVGKRGASEELGRAGIPGLKYYDGMSRNYIKVEPYGDSYQAVGLDGKGRLFKTRKEAEEYLDAEGIRTHNYVTWDQGVLNRMKLLERNGELFNALTD